MPQLIVICAFIFFCVQWVLNNPPQYLSQTPECNCPKLPEDYFIIQTDETVYCMNNKREREIKQKIKHSRKEVQ